ncbi:hypothetical protein CEXT_379531 [Caerostris extrusa]|uniref:Uncharacterized protein n=1 Tax=Caerostris extrusa TaxID=172846 RepID=A0AAV4PUS7_CAEEX|nr:hypothetical protein CEXT_379531 [Caerostris extrusa]
MVTKKTELIIPPMLLVEFNSLATRVINRDDDDFSYWAKNKRTRPAHSGRVAERFCYHVVAGHKHFCSDYERLRMLHFHITCHYLANSDGVVLIV